MLRRPSSLILPPETAFLSQDMRAGAGIQERRPGSVRLLGIPGYATAGLTFDGTTGKYVTFPDHAVYDLGTKWALCVHAKTTGTPGGTQYLLSRDVTPVSAGKRTFGIYINSSRQLGFESDLSDGTAADLTASSASVVAAATKFTALVVRDGTSLSMYLDGNPTAVLTATVSASLTQIAGAQPAMVGQNYDGSTRANAFDGVIGWVGGFRDFASAAQLIKYTTFQPYPDAKDPRVFLWAGFTYSIEGTGTTAYDLSTVANNGTITGGPVRAASLDEAPVVKVQTVFTFKNPVTGAIQNCAVVAGDLYASTVRSA